MSDIKMTDEEWHSAYRQGKIDGVKEYLWDLAWKRHLSRGKWFRPICWIFGHVEDWDTHKEGCWCSRCGKYLCGYN